MVYRTVEQQGWESVVCAGVHGRVSGGQAREHGGRVRRYGKGRGGARQSAGEQARRSGKLQVARMQDGAQGIRVQDRKKSRDGLETGQLGEFKHTTWVEM